MLRSDSSSPLQSDCRGRTSQAPCPGRAFVTLLGEQQWDQQKKGCLMLVDAVPECYVQWRLHCRVCPPLPRVDVKCTCWPAHRSPSPSSSFSSSIAIATRTTASETALWDNPDAIKGEQEVQTTGNRPQFVQSSKSSTGIKWQHRKFGGKAGHNFRSWKTVHRIFIISEELEK